jgi:hypothetical protein
MKSLDWKTFQINLMVGCMLNPNNKDFYYKRWNSEEEIHKHLDQLGVTSEYRNLYISCYRIAVSKGGESYEI